VKVRRWRPTCLAGLFALAACARSPDMVLEPVHHLLDDLARPLPEGTPLACAVDDETRPALGCAPHLLLARERAIVGEGGRVRRTFGLRRAGDTSAFLVEPFAQLSDDSSPTALPVALVDGPRKDVEVTFDVPSAIAGSSVGVSVYVVPAPPPRGRVKTRPVLLGPGSVLRVGIGLDPIGSKAGAAPVEFRLVARSRGSRRELVRAVLAPTEADGGRWHDYRQELGTLGGERVRFAFVNRVLARPGERREVPLGFPLWSEPEILESRPRGIRPNLLLISVDTLRADHLGSYGCDLPTSPNLDRVAAEGTVFEQTFATYPATGTSHATMFTSLYPSVHGVFGPIDQAPLAAPTLGEVVRAHGYQTGAVTEDGMLVASQRGQRGFGYYREHKGADLWDTAGQVGATFSDGLRWLEAHRGERFFLFLHTYQVHSPYSPPPAFDLFRSYRLDGREVPITDETAEAIRSRHAYAGEVRYVDSEFRRLLSGLEALGEADRTLVVVTSDHGEEFGEHGRIGHGLTLYDEVLRVPLILRLPRIVPAGLRVPVQVSLVDLMPTLLDLLHIPVPDTAQGRSLVPLLGDPRAAAFASRPVFAELKVAGLEAVGVRYAGYKWVFPRQPGAQVETYDLGADPGEQRDVGGSDLRERGEALAAQYATLVSSATTALASAPGVPAAPPAPPLDERTVQKLRALGYVQ